MSTLDSLLTLAEIAVAFAGFSSVVVLFSRRDEDGWRGFDQTRFRVMLLASLFAAFFAVLPLPLKELGVSHSVIWAACGGARVQAGDDTGAWHGRAARGMRG